MKSQLLPALFASLGLLSALPAFADDGSASPASPEQQVLAFEKARWDAGLKKDLKALDAMLADDLTYVHATGYSQTKQEYLADLANGVLTYHTYSIENPSVRIYGNVALTHGVLRFTVTSHGQEVNGNAFYTAVYVCDNGKFQLVSWQTTRIQPAQQK